MHACSVMLCLLALTAKTKQGKGLNTSSIQLAVEGIKRQRHKRSSEDCSLFVHCHGTCYSASHGPEKTCALQSSQTSILV